MESPSVDDRGRGTARLLDTQYALVAGLYVAAYLAPALVLGLSIVVSDAATLYVGFLIATVGVSAIAGWITMRIPQLAVGIGRRDSIWLLVVLPFVWFVGVFGADTMGVDPPGLAAPLAVIGTAGGMLFGIVLVSMSRTRHANAALTNTFELAEWEARWPQRWRRIAGGIVIVAFSASILGVLGALVLGLEIVWRLYYLMFVGVVFMNLLNPRTFRATERGLVIEHPLQRQFRPWSRYRGYEFTGGALTIRPIEWWRPAHRCEPSEIQGLEGVLAALDSELPHLE